MRKETLAVDTQPCVAIRVVTDVTLTLSPRENVSQQQSRRRLIFSAKAWYAAIGNFEFLSSRELASLSKRRLRPFQFSKRS